jgi:hypothetical protein
MTAKLSLQQVYKGRAILAFVSARHSVAAGSVQYAAV